MRTLAAALAALALSGCASFSAPSMSPEQLKEATKDKSMSAACLNFTGMGGSGRSVIVTLDQRVIINGGVEVDPVTCGIRINNTNKSQFDVPPAAPPTVVK